METPDVDLGWIAFGMVLFGDGGIVLVTVVAFAWAAFLEWGPLGAVLVVLLANVVVGLMLLDLEGPHTPPPRAPR